VSEKRIAVSVDHDLCIGSATCVSTAPNAFALGETGQSVVIDPEAEALETLMDAVSLCPTSAVIVIDVETGEQLEP
jgi:ferredoxin